MNLDKWNVLKKEMSETLVSIKMFKDLSNEFKNRNRLKIA